MTTSRTRLDKLLADRKLVETRAKAQALILAGKVLVDGQKVEKCGAWVHMDSAIRLLEKQQRYVSRAGLKLEGALDHFGTSPVGKTCLDIGASTGGFTDCLLQRGAVKVFAVDAGTNQLDWKLRQNPRVVPLEHTNARYLRFEQIGTRVPLVVMDVSFVSATLILPALACLMEPAAELIVLVKPQFEVGRGHVGKRGIVRDQSLHRAAIEKVSAKLADMGFQDTAFVESTLSGAEGNREYFLHALGPNCI